MGSEMCIRDRLKRGHFKWLSEKNMYYRIHRNNDSSSENIKDRIKLILAIRKLCNYPGLENDLMQYRYFSWIKWLKTEKSKFFIFKSFFGSRKFRVISTFLIKKSFILIFSSSDYRSFIFNLILRKLIKPFYVREKM